MPDLSPVDLAKLHFNASHVIYIHSFRLIHSMATTVARRLYQEEDLVDEYLLNQVSKWILYHHLGTLARDLRISQAEFSRIATPLSTPEEQSFKVNLQFI